jgi:hydrogenase nickel incorporation protein HypA/HybF
MHELAICQSLIAQVQGVARDKQAATVDRIVVTVGPLSGVEPELLQRAFEVAKFGTIAATAELVVQSGPVIVACRSCGAESTVPSNRLLCSACGNWRVRVISGEELLLSSVELCMPDEPIRHAHSSKGANGCVIPAAVQ